MFYMSLEKRLLVALTLAGVVALAVVWALKA